MTDTAKRPAVAIARVLRSLDLRQGAGGDFRITGEYRNGERVGTLVITLTRHADETIAKRADEVERLCADAGWSFDVSIRYYNGKPRPITRVANFGPRVRQQEPACLSDTAERKRPISKRAQYAEHRADLGQHSLPRLREIVEEISAPGHPRADDALYVKALYVAMNRAMPRRIRAH